MSTPSSNPSQARQPHAPWAAVAIGLLYLLAVGIADFRTPVGVSFSLFYLLGVVFVAWRAGLWYALAASAFATGIVVVIEILVVRPQFARWILFWDLTSRFLLFAGAGWVTARMAFLARHLENLVEERTAQLKAAAEDHKATSTRLAETLRRFQQVTDNIMEVFWLFDVPSHRFVYASSAYERIWGRRSTDLYGDPGAWLQAVHPEDQPGLARQSLAEKVRGAYRAEYRVVRPDGEVRRIRDRAFPVWDDQGRLCGIAGIAEDITERHVAEEALRVSEHRLADAMDLARLASWEYDVRTHRFTFDDRFYALYGTSAGREGNEMAPEVYAREFLFPEDAHLVTEGIAAALASTEPAYARRIEHRIRCRNGELRHISVRVARTRDSTGQIIKIRGVNQDITERVRAQEQLQLQARVLESMAEAVVVLDEEGRILLTNPALDSLMGYERGELLGKSLGMLSPLPPEAYLRELRASVEQVKTSGFAAGQYTARRKDGRLIEVETRSSQLTFGGRVVLVVVGQDVTQRKQTELALARNEERYRTLFEFSPDGILLEDSEGNILDVNKALCRSFGYSREELLGRNVRCLVPVEDHLKVRLNLDVLKGGRPLEHEVWNRRKSGERCLMWLNERPIPLPDGRQGILVVARDVTERKLAEEQLADALDLNQKILAASPMGIAAYKASGECVFVNEAFAQITGGSTSQCLQQDFHQLSSWQRDGRLRLAEQTLAQGGALSGEIHGRSSFGKDVWLDLHMAPFSRAGQAHLLCLADDIGERKRAESERQRLEHQLLEIADREQARIGQELHDGLCQQLVSLAFDANALKEELPSQLRAARARAERLADLLDHAISEARHLARGLFPVRIDAEGLVSALEELARSTRERFGIECRLDCDEPLQLQNQTMAIHLYRIAQEAVNNAVKHARASRLGIGLQNRGGNLELTVVDDGAGLPGSDLLAQSKGMGLHIMDYRARSIGGSLRVAAGPKGGVTVSCCVPPGAP